MPTHDEGARGYGLRQKPPVPAQGGGGGDSQTPGRTVLKSSENTSFHTHADKEELCKSGPWYLCNVIRKGSQSFGLQSLFFLFNH